ncbi:MAG: hypothetical protein K9G38_02420 [Bacteroidales bacterium]|nr:hypothetical protein [Bacteroidales bacterium]
MKIESKIGSSSFQANHIYGFITDFRNFKNFIPVDKISDWKADEDTCSFNMSMLGNTTLRITEKNPDTLLKIASDPAKSSYNFTLWIQIKEVAGSHSRIKLTIEPQLNKMMLSMAKTPLKNFIDSLIDEIEKFEFPVQ